MVNPILPSPAIINFSGGQSPIEDRLKRVVYSEHELIEAIKFAQLHQPTFIEGSGSTVLGNFVIEIGGHISIGTTIILPSAVSGIEIRGLGNTSIGVKPNVDYLFNVQCSSWKLENLIISGGSADFRVFGYNTVGTDNDLHKRVIDNVTCSKLMDDTITAISWSTPGLIKNSTFTAANTVYNIEFDSCNFTGDLTVNGSTRISNCRITGNVIGTTAADATKLLNSVITGDVSEIQITTACDISGGVTISTGTGWDYPTVSQNRIGLDVDINTSYVNLSLNHIVGDLNLNGNLFIKAITNQVDGDITDATGTGTYAANILNKSGEGYATMYRQSGSSATQALTGTYAKITGYTGSALSVIFDSCYTSTGSSFIYIKEPGHYLVSYTITWRGSAAGRRYYFDLDRVTDGAVTGSESIHTATSSTDYVTTSKTTLVNISDTNQGIYLRGKAISSGNIYKYNLNLTVQRFS